MNVDQVGLGSIKKSEGVMLFMYHDSVGLPTIGVGHLLSKSELSSGKININKEPVRWGNGLTTIQVEALLAQDLHNAEDAVDLLVSVPLTQNQFNALVSFVFNIGIGAFNGSRCLKTVNMKNYTGVPEQFRRWVYAGGLVQPGLQKRREEEVRLWNLP